MLFNVKWSIFQIYDEKKSLNFVWRKGGNVGNFVCHKKTKKSIREDLTFIPCSRPYPSMTAPYNLLVIRNWRMLSLTCNERELTMRETPSQEWVVYLIGFKQPPDSSFGRAAPADEKLGLISMPQVSHRWSKLSAITILTGHQSY
jgi:hypothetical protein